MHIRLGLFVITAYLLGLAAVAQAQVRLIGITGNQENTDQINYPDVTLFDIDLTNASKESVARLTWIPDGNAISFNPLDGMVYHAAGSEAWSDDPASNGFRDHHYLEAHNFETETQIPVFNANPPPSPDEVFSFGDYGPRPTWVLPQEPRLAANPSPRERGVNEYHAARDLAWSAEENLFYVSDEFGIFKLTPDGQSTFVGPDPGLGLQHDYKGLTFYSPAEGNPLLLAGTRRSSDLYVLDPATGQPVGDPVTLQVPQGSPYVNGFAGLLGLAQDPATGILYGIRRTDQESGNPYNRELVTIDPATGSTQLVGNLGLHFSSLTFVYSTGVLGDFDNSGVLDTADIDRLTRESAGGSNLPRYDLTGDSFVNNQDIEHWINVLFDSWLGDANLDGEFNSGDLVSVLTAGTYEVDVDSVWSTGDFNGDGRTNTSDLVTALIDGGYEAGPKPAVTAVPEPSGLTLAALAALALLSRRRDLA